MKRLFLIVAVASLTYGCASIPHGENCAYQDPPKEASPFFEDDLFGFIYPKALPDDYTGCQITWAENSGKSKIRGIFYFERGIPVTTGIYMGTQVLMSCRIEEKVKFSDETGLGCPSRDMVHDIVKKYQEAEPFKGEIPPDRDPRR